MDCLICSSPGTRVVFKNPAIYRERDVRYCESCNLFFIDPMPSREELKRLYETEWSWDYGMDVDSSFVKKMFQFVYKMHQKFLARERAAHLFETVPDTAARVLEIGSGNGAFLREICRRYQRVEGIEPTLKKDYQDGRIVLKRGAVDGAPSADQPYDVICMFMVLEHLHDPVRIMNNLKESLKKGGRLIVEVPFSPYQEFEEMGDFEMGKVFENVHLFHFSRKNVQLLARRTGLSLEEFKIIRKIEFIKGYNVFAVYPNHSRKGLAYKMVALFNLIVLYLKGIAGQSVHEPVDEEHTPFGDGFWIRFVLQK